MRRLAGLTPRQRVIFGAAGAGGFILLLVVLILLVSSQTSAAEEQPINFSHEIHAGSTVGLECRFCHYGVDEGPVAVIPSVELCMGCHQYVATETSEIEKLTEYWENQEPIPWKRVNEQPSFVYFAHHVHVAAGVTCGSCHGDVANMSVVEPVANMNMGFCLDCHAEQENKDALWDCAVCHR